MHPYPSEESWWGDGLYHITEIGQSISLYNSSLEIIEGQFQKLSNNNFSISFCMAGGGTQRLNFGGPPVIHPVKFLTVKEHPTNKNYYLIYWRGDYAFVAKKSELDFLGSFYPYKEVLALKQLPEDLKSLFSNRWLGVNLKKNCLNLRESPSTTSPVIDCIPSNDWWIYTGAADPSQITSLMIQEINSNWARVVVTFYYQNLNGNFDHPCDQFSEVKSKKGWIKLIDENNYPNVWFAFS